MRSSAVACSIDDVLAAGRVRSVFQPIVDLASGTTVGHEALARGPRGTSLERPDDLFAAALERGRTAELDELCVTTAARAAASAGVRRPAKLFVNVEPRSFRRLSLADPAGELARAARQLDVVVEVTERALADDPAAVVAGLRRFRELGCSIAVDDVGAEPASLALMPILQPEVIKLDLRLVQQRRHADVASIASAVMAQSERTGALILAEGVEDERHLAQAQVLGADLAQGWYFGRPDPSITVVGGRTTLPSLAGGASAPLTPFCALPSGVELRTAPKRLLMPMSHHLEQAAHRSADPPVVLSAFQHARHFTHATAKRYLALVPRCSLVGALGAELPTTPVAGVRGASIPGGHPLEGEWSVVVLGPHEAMALIARDVGDQGAEPDRRFEYVITHDRDTVVAAATSLLRLLEPVDSHAADHR